MNDINEIDDTAFLTHWYAVSHDYGVGATFVAAYKAARAAWFASQGDQAAAERVAPASVPFDKGPWHYRLDPKANQHAHRYFVESSDFSHDVRLYIDGHFADDEQRAAYGKALVYLLNAAT